MADYDRNTIIKRYYGRDKEKDDLEKADPDDILDMWVDIEITKTISIEQGGGLGFKRLHNSYNPDEDTRKKKQLKLFNPNGDESVWIPIPMISELDMESGGGISFNHITWVLDNTDDNEKRNVRIDRVYHYDGDLKDLPENARVIQLDDPKVDKGQYIDVEVPNSFTIQTGTGVRYQQTEVFLDTGGIPGAREEITREKAQEKAK